MSTRFGLVSFAADPYNPLMWSHYADGATGFVIGYNADSLRDLAHICRTCHWFESRQQRGQLRKVCYAEAPPTVPRPEDLQVPESKIYDLLSTKGEQWAYEEEWRLLLELSATVGTSQRDKSGQPVNLVSIPNRAVEFVYYTERTPIELVKAVRRRLSDPNNRFTAQAPKKLILTNSSYEFTHGYDEGT